jgi:hypothetical protein
MDAPVGIWMSCDCDVQLHGASAMAESLITIALTPNAIASGRRAVDGVDADAPALQPQKRQTAAPVLRKATSSRSPQHIGQVLPYRFILSIALQNSNLSNIPLALLRAAANDFLPGCRGAGRNRK